MSVRRAIGEVDVEGLNVSAFCLAHGISRASFYRWRARFDVEGEAGLEPRSRSPQRVANKTSVIIEDRVVEIRKQLIDDGFDAGAETIQVALVNDGLDAPSVSTIWRILHRRGFITPEPSKAPGRALRSFTAARANECWQLDDTSWALTDGTGVKIIDVIDDHSRVCVASVAVPSATGAAAMAVVADAAEVWGWPERILTDNAPAYRSVLATQLAVLGVGAGHSRPYHPQTCGKVERFHQTLKRYLDRHPAATLDELNTHLGRFVEHYNHHRPHRSLHRRTPAKVFTHAARSGPANRPLDQPAPTTRVWTTKVRAGRINGPDRTKISVGAAHDNRTATLIITGTRAHVFIDSQLIRELQLEPGKLTHPLYGRPGRPS